MDIDEGNRVIDIRFDGVFSEICPEVWDPVHGAWGDFGPLAAGDWIPHNSHDGSLAFTIVPEPATLALLCGGPGRGFQVVFEFMARGLIH